MRPRQLAALAGWGGLAFIAFATLGPIATRPHIPGIGANLERFVAFFGLALAFGLAYPRQKLRVLLLVAALAIGLEAAQFLEIQRHGRPRDAAVKLFGALAGIAIAAVAEELARRFRPADERS